jgi:capsular polysaccharide biosynthesis protein
MSFLVIFFLVVGAGLTASFSASMPTRYSATSTMVVQIPDTGTDEEVLIRTGQSLFTSSVVLKDVATYDGVDLSVRELRDAIDVARQAGSAALEVTVTDTSRRRASAVIDVLLPTVQARIRELDAGSPRSTVPINVRMFGGTPYVTAVKPPVVRDALIGGLAGLAIGVLIAVALSGRTQRAWDLR